MTLTADTDAGQALDFFAGLPVLATARDTFDATRYRPAPDDRELAITDIVDSAGAIAKGLHKTVNFVAAMGIAALRNLCAPTPIPFLFGGDGAVVMVPPNLSAQAKTALARVRGLASRDFGLTLRAGIVPMKELRRFGSDVPVGRFGLHVSDTALMTCLVTSPADSLHVHFVDGGAGGSTSASKGLRAA